VLQTWVVYQNTIHCCKDVVHDCSFSFMTCLIEILSRLISSSKEILSELRSKFIGKCFVSLENICLFKSQRKYWWAVHFIVRIIYSRNNWTFCSFGFLWSFEIQDIWSGYLGGTFFSPTYKEINIKFVLLACWNCGFMLLMCKIQVMYASFSGCVMRNIYDGALLYL